MFGIVLTSVISVLHAYVFWRAGTVPMIRKRVSGKKIFWSAVGIWVVFVLTFTFRRRLPALVGGPLNLFAMNWMGIVFLLAACFLSGDLVTGFGKFFPRIIGRLRNATLVVSAALVIVAYVQGLRPPAVIHHRIALPGLPRELDGTVLVALSDVHLGPFLGARWLAKRIRDIQSQDPDLVVLLGDLIDGRGGRPETWPPVWRELTPRLGLWAVVGNHERGDHGVNLLANSGIQFVRGTSVQVAPGLVLSGIDWPRGTEQENERALQNALENRLPGAAIFLTHEPTNAERAARAGIGLMLAGHTHGGQVWPFNYLVRTRYKFVYGRYQLGEMPVIVTRGMGTWGPRMRLWRRGEILRIVLKSGEKGVS